MSITKTHEWNNKKYEYPKIEKSKQGIDIIYFFQPTLKIIHNLTELEVIELKKENTRNYDYE